MFQAVADPTQWPEWMPDVASAKAKGDVTAPEVGAQYSVRQPGAAADTWVVGTLEPGQRAVLISGKTVLTYTLSDAPDGGTVVSSHLEMKGLLGKILSKTMGKSYDKQAEGELDGLKAYCERG